MQFINPRTDFAFKRIFGSEENKDILISFLNGMLYEGKSTIKSLEILNPYQAPKIRGVKDTYLDVKAVLDNEKTVIIEMQVLNVEGFEKRILYNAAKSYSMQLEIGQDYALLNPVIALTITDFKMFSNFDKAISRFILKERDFLVDYTIYDLELVFVELPKFVKEIDEVETLTEQWIYFLKSAAKVKEVPEKVGRVAAIRKAFEVANIATLNREELEDLEQREIYIIDQRNAIKRAERQGLEQGVELGSKQKSLEIASNLLDILDEAAISQITGLSLAEVQKLKEER
ncbi:Rpn family recombination-promoting nuclease/putative transposase [Limnofasciculus baicalensis]|uniref:Rpn family recombination-promoting nuclease/putative transposase n=1 Tax=Limnofasciculus baicalensis BBK-W-15 TaxID=2699891 RepID=A0AAE3KQI2_9CYAN|nr:Rpn family recombination-promoting nuclease/putative transposase [Limnofasciculus baicalensis]MCP2732509.1 Rpn family recombination-promoting nuclease/putative transposase [Limnofasciculus baicalensis BBK-W-15]